MMRRGGASPKSGQPELGHETAEGAKVRGERLVLIALCGPAASCGGCTICTNVMWSDLVTRHQTSRLPLFWGIGGQVRFRKFARKLDMVFARIPTGSGHEVGRGDAVSYGKNLGTRRFQRAVSGARPIGSPQRAWGRMGAIANDNRPTQGRRHRERLLPINTSFAETARWKRRVPRGVFHYSTTTRSVAPRPKVSG